MRRNHLLQLLHDNRGPFTPIQARIVQADKGKGEATVYLYDPIVGDRLTAEWWGGVCPQDFVPALAAIEADTIRLRINCGGGDVFAAEAMCQAIRDQKAHVVAQVEGLAASAATVITCACDEVLITANSKFMVHESWTFAMGNKRDLAQTIELLAKADQTMFEEYVRKTGATMEEVVAWCEAETWFTGQEAVDAKFADGLVSATQAGAKASARAQWKLSAYSKPPADHTPAEPPEPAEPAKATPDHRARQQQRLRVAALLDSRSALAQPSPARR